MRVVIGSDHAGFDQKERIKAHLVEQGHDVRDVGTGQRRRFRRLPRFRDRCLHDSWPPVTLSSACLVCGTGIGMSIAANKVRGVRAANVTIPEFARLAREHNNANVVTVSARFVPVQVNEEIVDAFLATPFSGGRHADRVEQDHGRRDRAARLTQAAPRALSGAL